jgi:hypothetical protein
MLTTTPRITLKAKLVTLAASAAAVVATMAAGAAPADAYSTSTSGYTGYTGVPATYGHQSWAYGGQIFMAGRKVCTANAFPTSQTVEVTFRNWKWLGGQWKPYGYNPNTYAWKPSLTLNYRLAANSCVTTDNVRWQVAATSADTAGGSYGGYFSSDIIFRWYRRSDGAFLGKKTIDYNGNDFLCDSNLPGACVTGNGWVWLRGFSSKRAGTTPSAAGPRTAGSS